MGFRRQATCSDCSDADSDAVVHPPLVGSDWIGPSHRRYGQADREGRKAPDDQFLHQITTTALLPPSQWTELYTLPVSMRAV